MKKQRNINSFSSTQSLKSLQPTIPQQTVELTLSFMSFSFAALSKAMSTMFFERSIPNTFAPNFYSKDSYDVIPKSKKKHLSLQKFTILP